jgi:hypothetical protein
MSEHVACREAASRYVAVLFGSVAGGLLIEVRFRAASGMRRRFFPTGTPGPVVDTVLALATRTDVFIGVLPRVRRRGRLEDVAERAGVLWADCDTPASAAALASFQPRPSMVVASGSGQHRHAYWLLREPVDLLLVERLNRRLALALGADAGVVTRPHTILRPPGSVNRKHSPPTPVCLIGVRETRRVSGDELDRQLAREQPRIEVEQHARLVRRRWRATAGDPLQSVPPPVYVEQLTGQRVGRSGKVRCPFHEDRTPSLHVYDDPERGWYCFGCGRGGSIYDLAALLCERETRGRGFIELRRELEALVR